MDPMFDSCIPTQSLTSIPFSSFFRHISSGWGLWVSLFFIMVKTNIDYCRYDFVLKNTVISESVRTCSSARAL